MNKYIYIIISPVIFFLVSGCASIVSGVDQDIAIYTNPEGAECILTREGRQLRKVVTPDNVRVSKLKYDIDVKCSLEGFYESTAVINSGTEGSVFGNILLGGGIGWAIDSARGADNKYANVVTVTMVPLMQTKQGLLIIGTDGEILRPKKAKSIKVEKTEESEDTREKNESNTKNSIIKSDIKPSEKIKSIDTEETKSRKKEGTIEGKETDKGKK